MTAGLRFHEFARQLWGKNWVLHRRTDRILRKYGDDVRCITHDEYRRALLDYERQTGTPVYGGLKNERA